MSGKPLHKRCIIYETAKAYTLVPVEPSSERSLTIRRSTGEIRINSAHSSTPSGTDQLRHKVYGVLGIISLALGDYLILCTGRMRKGDFLNHTIYRATDFAILPLSLTNQKELPPAEKCLLALLKTHLSQAYLLFSYDWDVTRRLQSHSPSDADKYLWEVADDRFFWNKNLQARFMDVAANKPDHEQVGAFILPVMFGTFDIRPATLKGRTLQLAVISRRSRYRAGTRYFRRGVDASGHVANFNETEQILLLDRQGKRFGDLGERLSFVQIRGSIPLFWSEINTLRYKPDLQVMELANSETAMRLHLEEQARIYGEQNIVSLVKQKGHEKPVKEAYEKYLDQLNLPIVKYDYFDFANECKNMKWDRINVLIDRLKDDLLRQGYYHATADSPEPVKIQQGVVRTNCMDNLDRTNVAQSAIAKWMLDRQLEDVGVFDANAGETVETHAPFMEVFRNMWADHADSISKAYSGTGALKTDYTRTGRRSTKGLLDDGVNSVMRYLRNNYFDGPRQDGYDLFTGNWNPGSAAVGSLVLDRRPLLIRSMPSVAFWSFFMICCGLTLPRTSTAPLQYWHLLWLTVFVLSIAFLFVHGIHYVSWPRLNPLTDIIYYDGPGFRATSHGRGLGIGTSSKALLKFAPMSYREWVESGERERMRYTTGKSSGHEHGRGLSRAGEMEMGEIAKKRLE